MATSKKSTSLSPKENMSTSVRKIENGFLVSQSGTTGSGRNQKWVEKQFFSPTDPLKGITAPKGKR